MRFRVGLVAASLLFVAAACGSDSKSSSTTTSWGGTTATTAAGGSTTSSGGAASTTAHGSSTPAGSAAAADGTPVKVLVILDESAAANNFLDTARAGAKARVDRINAEGGLGGSGRPVALDFCVTDLDPNKTLACVDKAANDPSYVASAANFSSAAETAAPLAKAGLASIPGASFLPGDWSGANVFNINSGAFIVAGVGTLACKVLGYKSLVEGRNNLPASAAASQLTNAALQSNGCAPLTQSVDIPVDAADVSTQVAALGQSKADAATLDILPSLSEQIFPARQQLGITKPFVAASGSFTSDGLKNIADAAEGTPIAAWMPTDDSSSAGNAQYLKDYKASGADAGLSGDTSKSAYVSLDLLNYAAKSASTIDRAGILAALNKVNDYTANGLTPTLDFTKPGPNPSFPRMVNLDFFQAKVKGGKFVVAGDEKFVAIFGAG